MSRNQLEAMVVGLSLRADEDDRLCGEGGNLPESEGQVMEALNSALRRLLRAAPRDRNRLNMN